MYFTKLENISGISVFSGNDNLSASSLSVMLFASLKHVSYCTSSKSLDQTLIIMKCQILPLFGH